MPFPPFDCLAPSPVEVIRISVNVVPPPPPPNKNNKKVCLTVPSTLNIEPSAYLIRPCILYSSELQSDNYFSVDLNSFPLIASTAINVTYIILIMGFKFVSRYICPNKVSTYCKQEEHKLTFFDEGRVELFFYT